MSTFDSRAHIDQFIANNGWLDSCLADKDAPDNPPATRIVEYTNAWGNTTYGVTFATDPDPYRYERPSEYVNKPKVIWTRRPVAV